MSESAAQLLSETGGGKPKDGDGKNPRLSHAWDWFKYHAEQRMLLIRFYLILSTALGAGTFALFKEGHFLASSMVCVLGAIASFGFLRLDKRTGHLIKIAELALKKEQDILTENGEFPEIRMVQAADNKMDGHFNSYGSVFRMFFRTAIFSYAVFFAASICQSDIGKQVKNMIAVSAPR